MRHTQIQTLSQCEQHLATHRSLSGCIVQGLDLRGHSRRLLDATVADTVFLGCKLLPEVVLSLTARGAVLFPDLSEGRPYHPTRGALYSIDELMVGYHPDHPGSFESSVDADIYRHFQSFLHQSAPPLLETLAQRLHDHAIDDALNDLLLTAQAQRVVGVMGGHALLRGSPTYCQVAQLGFQLAKQGYFVATGGGPGAMEAANLGAWMSNYDSFALDLALEQLAVVADYRSHGYLTTAFAVRDRYPNGATSLAIPTWFYGHEPTNPFAPHIAKYFSNSLREDGLLAIAKHGVIYAPGSAGTIQEVFMDATQNHYATFGVISPMVFFDEAAWSGYPVVALLRKLARNRPYAAYIATVSTAEQAVAFLRQHPPLSA